MMPFLCHIIMQFSEQKREPSIFICMRALRICFFILSFFPMWFGCLNQDKGTSARKFTYEGRTFSLNFFWMIKMKHEAITYSNTHRSCKYERKQQKQIKIREGSIIVLEKETMYVVHSPLQLVYFDWFSLNDVTRWTWDLHNKEPNDKVSRKKLFTTEYCLKLCSIFFGIHSIVCNNNILLYVCKCLSLFASVCVLRTMRWAQASTFYVQFLVVTFDDCVPKV